MFNRIHIAEAVKKGRVGLYEYWLVGKMQWEVRKDGKVIDTAQNMSDCVRKCNRYYNLDKDGVNV